MCRSNYTENAVLSLIRAVAVHICGCDHIYYLIHEKKLY